MSVRQLDAYLLMKDMLRRIQRTAALFDGNNAARLRQSAP